MFNENKCISILNFDIHIELFGLYYNIMIQKNLVIFYHEKKWYCVITTEMDTLKYSVTKVC